MAISDINPETPSGQDTVNLGDDQIRQLKQDIVDSFGGIAGAVYEDADVSGAGGSTPVSEVTMSSWEARIQALEGAVVAPEAGNVPVGMISFWPGGLGAVPSGWKICDGQTYQYLDGNGEQQSITTPDLRGRFLTAALATNGPDPGDSGGPVWSDEGAFGPQLEISVFTGGAHSHSVPGASHSLTDAQMPAHYHFSFRMETGNHENSPVDQQFDTPIWKATAGNPDNQRYTLSAGSSQNRANALWTSTAGSGQGHTHPARQSAAAGGHEHTAWVTPRYYCGNWCMYIGATI